MATEMFGGALITSQQQETHVTKTTRVETYNSYEQEKIDNKEKMRSLNDRFLYILEEDDILKLRVLESKLQKEREVFKTAVHKFKMEYKSKMEETRIKEEDHTILKHENTRLETKVKELSTTLKTVAEELEATRQSLHQYEKSIAEKDLKIITEEGQVKFFESKYHLADEQSKKNQKHIEELIDTVERNAIKQEQDKIRIESLNKELEFIMTLNQEVNETGRSEHTISKYLMEAKSELEKLMMNIKQSCDAALTDYINQQRVLCEKKVDNLLQETSRSYMSMITEIQERNKRTTTELVQESFKQQEEFAQLKIEYATKSKQVVKLKKEIVQLKAEMADLRSHEIVIFEQYHETSESMLNLFFTKLEEITKRRITEDNQLTPEIETYQACISKTEQRLGIQSTDQVFICDENPEMKEIGFRSVKTEPMRSSTAANGDKNGKDDEEECD